MAQQGEDYPLKERAFVHERPKPACWCRGVRQIASFLAALWILSFALPSRAEASGRSPRGPLFFPTGPGAGQFRVAAGASLDILPQRLVESEIRELPRLCAAVRFGLPAGFSTDARVAAIVVANEFELGAAWAHHVGDFAFSIKEHLGVWYGTVGTAGFDASAWGLLHTPGLSVGIPQHPLRFSLSWELLLLQGQHVNVGGSSVDKKNLSYEGHRTMLILEHLFASGGILYFGAGVIYARPDYQLWLAFSDVNRKTFYPRFVIGYEF